MPYIATNVLHLWERNILVPELCSNFQLTTISWNYFNGLFHNRVHLELFQIYFLLVETNKNTNSHVKKAIFSSKTLTRGKFIVFRKQSICEKRFWELHLSVFQLNFLRCHHFCKISNFENFFNCYICFYHKTLIRLLTLSIPV